MPRICSYLLLGFCLTFASTAAAEVAQLTVTTLDGDQQTGELVAWDEQNLTIKRDEQLVVIDSAKLLRVQEATFAASVSDSPTFVELVNGARLPHASYVAQGRMATITTPWSEQPIELSTDRIRYVQLAANLSWQEIRQHELTEDLLVIRKKSTGEFNFLEGILGDVTPEQVDFNWDDEDIAVKRSKIAALGYYHAKQPPQQKFICWLNLHDGGRLPIQKLSLSGDRLEVTTAGELKLALPVDALRNADFSQGKLVYLSDLEPLDVKWNPRIDVPTAAEFIKQYGQPRRDRSFDGSMLSLFWPESASKNAGGELKHYSKGLALRSRTELRYRLPTGMKRFIAIAGIDPETSAQGNVTLEIFAGRDSLWQRAIDGSAAPTEIDIPLDGATELRIFVDYGANLDFGDRLHLIEARVSQ